MKLQEAIELVLRKAGKPLSVDRIAEIIPTAKNGEKVLPVQVLARVESHSEMFLVEGNFVALRSKDIVDHYEKMIGSMFERYRGIIGRNHIVEIGLPLLLSKWLFDNRESRDRMFNLAKEEEMLGLQFNLRDLFSASIDFWMETGNSLKKRYDEAFELPSLVTQFFNQPKDLGGEPIRALVGELAEVLMSEDRISFDDFGLLFDRLIKIFFESKEYFVAGNLPTPVLGFLCEMIYSESPPKTLIPFGGTGSSSLSLFKKGFVTAWDVHVFEASKAIFDFGQLNFIANRFKPGQFENQDFFNSDRFRYYKKQFDLALMFPPFNQRARQLSPELREVDLPFGIPSTMEWVYFQKMLEALKDNGKMVSMVVSSPLFASGRDEKVRKEFVKNNLVEAVIRLPMQVLASTSLAPSIIIINKGRKNSNTDILFVDFQQESEKFSEVEFAEIATLCLHAYREWKEITPISRIVSADEVAANNYILDASRYVHKEFEALQKFRKGSKEIDVQPLTQILKRRKVGKHIAPDENIPLSRRPWRLPMVKGRDLSRQRDETFFDPSQLDTFFQVGKASDRFILRESAILMSLVGRDFYPIYFEFSGHPILLGNSIVALIPDSQRVIPKYLLMQLRSEQAAIQLEMQSVGTSISRLNIRDLDNLMLPVPSMEEQERQVFEFEKGIEQEQKDEETLRTDEFTILSAIKHSLSQQLGAIRNDVNSLKFFLQRKIDGGELVTWEDSIRKQLGEQKGGASLSALFERLEATGDNVSETFKNIENVIRLNREALDFKHTNVKQFIQDEIMAAKLDQKGVRIKVGGYPYFASLDHVAFREVVRNLIENSIQHGFSKDHPDPRIEIDLGKAEQPGFFCIRYMDNGSGFPSGFKFEDYISYGKRSGQNRGTGLGGYIIRKVIEVHQGQFLLNFNVQQEFGGVVFEVILPKED
jgi:type I restriction enzyme M protein